MTQTRRWCIVALGVVMLVALPITIRLLPVRAVAISAADLLAEAQSSGSVAYSGQVESEGDLGLPLSNQFSNVADLLGGRTTMRVWWRGPQDWRVDDLTTTGESDLFQDANGTTTWNYESDRATVTPDASVRLPRASDLLPPTLALRVLSGASPGDVSRLSTQRIAGVVAPGLRLRPHDDRSSIDHVDVWVEPRSGLPLRVDIFGKGSAAAALTTTFVDVTVAMPPSAVTRFTLPPGAEQRFDDVADLAAAANRYSPLRAPDRLLGIMHHTTGYGAVGLYGSGLSQIIAIPLWEPAADPLRKQLQLTPGSTADGNGTALSVGLLNLRLTGPVYQGNAWLLAGTVTAKTLARASAELSTHAPLLRTGGRLGGPRSPS